MKALIALPLLGLGLALSLNAHAHRSWMLPSSTVLSGDSAWVTVDAAVSNDLFYFEHFPLQIKDIGTPPDSLSPRGNGPGAQLAQRQRALPELRIDTPDGHSLSARNGHIGRLRSTFDLQLQQPGTYRLSLASGPRYMASYKEGEETRRLMGSLDELRAQLPPAASEVQISRRDSRMETFITLGNPDRHALGLSGEGLELQALTHPNDLVAGETTRWRFLLDGQPAANLELLLVPGAARYRDQSGEIQLTTDAQGEVAIDWPQPGMYWLEATARQDASGETGVDQRSASYIATFEVLGL